MFAAEGQRPSNYSSCCSWIFCLIYALSTSTTVLPPIFKYFKSIYLSIYRSIYWSIYLSIYPSIHLAVFFLSIYQSTSSIPYISIYNCHRPRSRYRSLLFIVVCGRRPKTQELLELLLLFLGFLFDLCFIKFHHFATPSFFTLLLLPPPISLSHTSLSHSLLPLSPIFLSTPPSLSHSSISFHSSVSHTLPSPYLPTYVYLPMFILPASTYLHQHTTYLYQHTYLCLPISKFLPTNIYQSMSTYHYLPLLIPKYQYIIAAHPGAGFGLVEYVAHIARWNLLKLGSGCGSVGRAVAFKNQMSAVWLQSSANFYWTIVC